MIKGDKLFNEFSIKYSNDYVVIKENSKNNDNSFQITHNNEKYSDNKIIISEQQIISELEKGNSFKNVSCFFKLDILRFHVNLFSVLCQFKVF